MGQDTTMGQPVSNVRSAAQLYISKGWQVVPLAPKSKRCTDNDWIRLIFKASDFRDEDNIGIRSVGGLVDIDCDAPEVVACAKAFLPPTGAVYGRPNKPSAHWLYYSTLDKLVAYKDAGAPSDKATLIELRVNHQSMAPPSVHPDGQQLAWEGECGDAAHIDIDVLHRAVRLCATCAAISRYYNPPGQRHDWGIALTGRLRQLGLTEEECSKIFEHAATWARDTEVRDRLNAVRSTFSRADDDPMKAGKALIELMQKGKDFLNTINRIWGSSSSAFVLDQHGDKIQANSQENIKRALAKLECSLSFDLFAQKPLVEWKGKRSALDDTIRNRLWLEIDRTFGFRPNPDFFDVVIQDTAYTNAFHPVCDYLDALKWDGTPRLDTWLTTSAKAADSDYIRAVSSLVLIAAVRRVRHPGCKFDELMVLESEQGWQKSTALRTLCPLDDWFSDDLPLDVDAKQLIERTLGKWFIEASDLSGMNKARVEHLKSTLSRQIDGPVRLAYARLPVERPRQFVIVGTTNAHSYLKDATGNRRFWPVRVQRFDVDWVAKHRDQLWAEAALRERRGESTRLSPSLYEFAAMQQERRRAEDPWEDRLLRAYDDEKAYRVTYDSVWEHIGVPIAQRDDRGHERLCLIMQRLGFRRMSVRDGESKKVVKGWGREARAGQPKLQLVTE